ncbi:MAG TPA: hypothetical protein VLF41_02005 [Candidatus Nanoarchaeia archaeon]|nr:hypothetical protein [Candidatus Nanoarchaeia archaeon]
MSITSFNLLAGAAMATGALTSSKVTLSDPRGATAGVTYTINWTEGTDATLKCILYDFWSNAAGTTVPSGMSTTAGPAAKGTFTGLTAGSWTLANTTSGALVEMKLTDASGEEPGGSSALTPVSTAFTNLTNPTSSDTTYYLKISTFTDTGCSTPSGGNDTSTVAWATVSGVTVGATIDPTLSFAVAGVAPSTTYKGALSTSDRCSDTATAVTFGTSSLRLAVDTNYDCAQSLTTTTNGAGGYQVTVTGKQASGDFLKNIGNPAYTITNWTGTNGSPTATATSGSSEQFAYTTSDSTLSGTATRFTASDNLFAGLTTTADEVAYASTPVSADSVNVGYRLRFDGTTEAGTYQGTLTYTCTPTF